MAAAKIKVSGLTIFVEELKLCYSGKTIRKIVLTEETTNKSVMISINSGEDHKQFEIGPMFYNKSTSGETVVFDGEVEAWFYIIRREMRLRNDADIAVVNTATSRKQHGRDAWCPLFMPRQISIRSEHFTFHVPKKIVEVGEIDPSIPVSIVYDEFVEPELETIMKK